VTRLRRPPPRSDPGAEVTLADLRAAVTGVGPGKSLENKIKAVQDYLAAGKKGLACGMLENGFPNEVDAQKGKTITAAQAKKFKKDAARIANVIGC